MSNDFFGFSKESFVLQPEDVAFNRATESVKEFIENRISQSFYNFVEHLEMLIMAEMSLGKKDSKILDSLNEIFTLVKTNTVESRKKMFQIFEQAKKRYEEC
jgi:hypothetical protein